MLTFEDDEIATIKPIKGDKNIEIKMLPKSQCFFRIQSCPPAMKRRTKVQKS
jgi:hypothetical protein